MKRFLTALFLIVFIILLFLAGAGLTQAESTCPSFLYNHKTQQYEEVQGTPLAEKMPEFIPQKRGAQGLYRAHIKLGKTPIEAAVLVLKFLDEIAKKNSD